MADASTAWRHQSSCLRPWPTKGRREFSVGRLYAEVAIAIFKPMESPLPLAGENSPKKGGGRRCFLSWAYSRGLPAMVVAMAGAIMGWAGFAAWFGPLPRVAAVPVVLACLALQAGLGIAWRPFSRAAWACLSIGVALVLAWSIGLRPSNRRPWQPDLARTAFASFAGRRVTVHNVRNCHYRSATDFDVQYEDRTYDLGQLRHADLYLVDWGVSAIAHTMLSFGFADGQYLCFSIETRKEVGEEYSAVRGFFRNYELIYVAADERDVVRLRTNFRDGETVRLYRLHPRAEGVVENVFREYLLRLNQLHARPEWYNALTDNCMTSAYKNIRKHAVRKSWDWRILANGHAAELAYAEGTVDRSLPFARLQEVSAVNSKARAVPGDADFSAAIRDGLPGVASMPR